MVDKNEMRAAFSARLHEALDGAGVRIRGRGVDIQAQLKRSGVNRTPQAVSKWLNGEAMAEADSMTVLCSWLNVRREWLEYGIPPKMDGGEATVEESCGGDRNRGLNSAVVEVPLLSWAQAESRCAAARDPSPVVSEWICCPTKISKYGFALKVRGDAMTGQAVGRSYPDGCLIFVDPEIQAQIGDSVVAKIPGKEELTFKVLAEDAGRYFLRPINPQYPIIDITQEFHICGKVVGAFIHS